MNVIDRLRIPSPNTNETVFPSSCLLRIQHELQNFAKEPIPFLYLHAEESNITTIKAMIIGPLETPYAGGFFTFDIRMKPQYPFEPPEVMLKTTDGGRVRFNPNLYSSGKVCLSVLGTWHGPAWSSAESIASVLLSIQSLMCAKPYHNEPGYENRGDQQVIDAYSDYIRYETLRVAVLDAVKHPIYEEEFGDIIRRHFLKWYEMHLATLKDMKERLNGQRFTDAFSSRTGTYEFDSMIQKLQKRKAEVLAKYHKIAEPPNVSNGISQYCSTSTVFAKERLLDEYEVLTREAPQGISASPRNKEEPFIWDVTIVGPHNTPLEGGLFPLEVRFSTNHPYDCPFVRFTRKMFHPNITSDGIPALDLINTRWKPETRIVHMLKEVEDLLVHPKSVYPVNSEAASLFIGDRSAYDKRVRRLAQEF